MFDTCEDVVAEPADAVFKAAREGRQGSHSIDGGELVVNSAALQSFTFPEFFFRCSAAFKQVECRGMVWQRLQLGRSVRLGIATKDKTFSANASLLNSLLLSGKTKRATRTSANFGASRGKTASISILGNAHPDTAIPMGRGCPGPRAAVTKVRFVFCLDRVVTRHAPLPEGGPLEAGNVGWTWLPLAAQQAAVYGWDRFKDDPAAAIRAELRVDDCSQSSPCEG
ncbi:unnamed protein product, partial [Prorocentrum cordatum]